MKKTVIAIIIRFIVVLSLFSVAVPLFPEECGDVNSDNQINIVDALMIAQHYVGLLNLNKSIADVNSDDHVNILDALLVAQYYVGIIAALPGCIPAQSGTVDLPGHYHESGGFATKIEGGLGGQVYKVTNLKSSGAGSFQDALSGSNRLIVFEVSGVINMQGRRLIISGRNLTIAGQTAPAQGITIIRGDLEITGSNIVMSHLTVMVGDADGEDPDCINIKGGTDIVIDHVATAWSVDEGLSLVGAKNVTLFKCLIAEGLSHSTHTKSEHSKGSLINQNCDNISIIGCLYAHNALRNPRVSDSRVAMVNSMVYNWAPGKDEFQGDVSDYNYVVHLGDNGEKPQIPEVSFVGNVGLSGPNSVGQYFLSGHKTEQGKAYMEDNIILDTQGRNLFLADEKIILLDSPPIWPTALKVIPAHESLYEILRTVGPSPGQRGEHVKRIMKTVAEGGGRIIDSQNEVGGYPDYTGTRSAVSVPNGVEARRDWLDSLEDAIAVDKNLDLSRLSSWIGSVTSDRLK